MDKDLKHRIADWLERYTYEHGRTSHRKAVELFQDILAAPDPPTGREAIQIKVGDTVYHRPTGETWTVKRINEDGFLTAMGWPETGARIADCVYIGRIVMDEEIYGPPL